MKELTLHLCGPFQRYGLKPEKNIARTSHKPTKSAIVGLIARCGGIPRNDFELKEISDSFEIAKIECFETPGVDKPLKKKERIEILRDFQSRRKADGSQYFMYMEYIEDTYFQVTLNVEDEKCELYRKWLQDPYWVPYLGRNDCVPSLPIILDKLPYKTCQD